MRTITRPHPPVVMRAMFRRGAAKEASTNKPTVGGDAGAGTGPGGGGGASAAARAHPYASRPTTAWDKLKVKQTVLKATNTVSPDTPKPDGHTRFVCISDTHTKTKFLEVPPGDVLLHAGDFTSTGLPREVERFRDFLDALPHQHKVVIAGNHDLTFDEEEYGKDMWKRFSHPEQYDCRPLKEMVSSLDRVTYLEDAETTVNGIRIWGSPWQPVFCDWAFNLPRGEKCLEKWDLIPEGVDVVMTHGPPIGHGDLCRIDKGRAGCVDLLLTLQNRVKPKYHVFGHIHEGYGATTDGNITYINCSTCNFNYKPIQPPFLFDLPNRE